jgi:hypothetical protein
MGHTAFDARGVERVLAAHFFRTLARGWARLALIPAAGLALAAGATTMGGLRFTLALAWGLCAALAVAFDLLAIARSAAPQQWLHAPAGTRLEAGALRAATGSGLVLAAAALWPSLLPPALVLAAVAGWAVSAALVVLAGSRSLRGPRGGGLEPGLTPTPSGLRPN